MVHSNSGGRSRLEKARVYNRLKRNLGYGEFAAGVCYLLALLVFGWTFDLREIALRAGGGPVVWVLVYFVLAMLIYEIATLPFSLFSGYFLEKKFGMLKQTFGDWIKDMLKSQAVGLVLGIIAIETLYLFLRIADDWWWFPAGTSFALLFILLAQLLPVLILPIFYKFKKLPDSDLTNKLHDLCGRANARVNGIYEWGLSSKTVRANAALVGWGPTRRVVLSDSLLRDFTPSEIEVVLAHELGHHTYRHLPRLLALQIALTFGAFFLADKLFRFFGPYFGLGNIDDVASMPLLLLVFILAGLVTLPAVNAVSRRYERQADYYALALTGLVGSFISAMERLAALNLSEMEPNPVVEFVFYSHPAPAKRVNAAKEFMYNRSGKTHALH